MVIDQWDLAFDGPREGQADLPSRGGRRRAGRIRLTGHVRRGEVRVHSGGIAQLSAICSREYLADARRAHAAGGRPPSTTRPAAPDPPLS